MLRAVQNSFSYLLCLAAGVTVGVNWRVNQRLMPVVAPVQQGTLAVVQTPVATEAVPGGHAAKPPEEKDPVPKLEPAAPPPGLLPYQLQDWMRERWKEGRDDLALAAFLARPDLAERQGIAESFAGGCEHLDPHAVARVVLSLPSGMAADRALRELLSEWARADALEAVDFMETLPAERLTGLVLGSSGYGLSELPAERLAAFAGKLNAEARGTLVDALTAMADQAGSWSNLQRFTELVRKDHPEMKESEYERGILFASSVPAQVEQWIAASTEPARRDMLISGYTRSFERGDPQRALQWDARITSAAMRDDEVGRHVSAWLRIDRVAALQWLKSDAARTLMTPALRRSKLLQNGLEAVR